MKIIVQIPCHNEEKTLPLTYSQIPKHIPGVDVVEIQVIDDGSSDRTAEVAKQLQVHHLISFPQKRGLAAAFKAGVDNALKNGADILVNTDGDNQYNGADIPALIAPLMNGAADIVVGCRPIKNHPEFSRIKKILQRIGSMVLRYLSHTEILDAASGFRAFGQNAMLRLNIYSSFSYSMESLIQAGLNGLIVKSVNIRVNPKTRESRLFKNILHYVFQSSSTIIGTVVLYRAWNLFLGASLVFFGLSGILCVRYLILTRFFNSPSDTFWPTIVLSGILLVLGLQSVYTGLIASLLRINRKLSEEILYRSKSNDLHPFTHNKRTFMQNERRVPPISNEVTQSEAA